MLILKKVLSTSLLPLLLFIAGCSVSPLQETNPDRSLNWCPPLLNCASTEAVTFVHSIQPFKLKMPIEEAWPIIQSSVSELKGTTIKYEYEGYIYAKSYSAVFNFVDYFEVLAVPEEQRLNIRSSSLLGLTDFFVNYFRTETLRESLEEKGVIETEYDQAID